MKRTPLKRQGALRRTPFKKKRKTTQATKKRRKKGEWSTKTADAYFSKYIRARDGKCMKCGTTENLTCSHYHRRAISATRFLVENNDALCGACHYEWEGPTRAYTEWKIAQLGDTGFLELQKIAGESVKRADAVAEWKVKYESVRTLF